jgi:beta-lactamase class A
MGKLNLLKKFERRLPGYFGAVVGTAEAPTEALHPHEIFPAASLIKLPILFFLLKKVDDGALNLHETLLLKKKDKVGGSGILFELHDGIELTLLDLAVLMIVVSDNTATNLLIDKLGMKKIQHFIESLGLANTILGRKLMVAPHRPPANFTTPMDMFLLLQKLLQGKLLSQKNTRLALEILFRQQYNEKIPLLLPQNVKTAHKTGEIQGVRHDCGIIQEGKTTWIGCFLTKNVQDALKADRIIAETALACHRYFRMKNP